jgi:hypothetical protein
LLTVAILLVTAALAAGAAAVASRQSAKLQEPSGAEGKPVVANKAGKNLATATTAGQAAQVDGQAQEISPEEARKLAAELKPLLNTSADGLKEVQHADGSVSVDLDNHFQNVIVAKVDKSGKVVQGCVNSPKAASGFLGGGAQPVGGEETPNTSPKPAQTKIKN